MDGSSSDVESSANRRALLRGVGLAGVAAMAGCLGSGGDDGDGGTGGDGGSSGDGGSGPSAPPLVENRPDAVYVPTHVEGMKMAGMGSSEGYQIAVSYTYPHRFWTTQAGSGTQKVTIQDGDSVHLMLSVWHADSGVFVTDAAPSVEVTKGGKTVVGNNNPWAMLSQPMGFHFGDNVQLEGAGTYTVSVETSAPTTERTGSLAGVGGRAAVDVEFEFEPSKLREIRYEQFRNRKGNRGAARPMRMEMLPLSYAPKPADLPGLEVGTGRSGDAKFLVRALDGKRMGAPEKAYLAVSARTPYNRFVVPQMSLKATLSRGSETVFEGPLTATLDPELNFHYGAAVDGVQPGDELAIQVQAPPQVARHEGYETAFLKMDPLSMTVPEAN